MTTSRRNCLRTAAAFLAGSGAQAAVPSKGRTLKIAQGLNDVAEEALRLYRQLGIEYVTMPASYNTVFTRRPLSPPVAKAPGPGRFRAWDTATLARVKQRIEAAGLKPELIHIGGFHRLLLGRPGWEEDIEVIKQSVRAAGEAGIAVVEYSFIPLRASEGYYRATGRGGSGLRAFDYDRVQHLAPLEGVGRHSHEETWERLTRFLTAVVPEAEKAGVRLACHPNDPPVAEFRGVAQPVSSLADLKRLISVVDSPSNGITLDTGVTTEMGENAVEAIRYFGQRDRINHVHFRNVRVQVPKHKYSETFHDEGECDMPACMKAFREVGYARLIIPDHTPEITGDTTASAIGWAWALGYMRALEQAAG
jgi:mannonate dehydratase